LLKLYRELVFFLKSIFILPVVCLLFYCKNKLYFKSDVINWVEKRDKNKFNGKLIQESIRLFIKYNDFRSQIYYRIKYDLKYSDNYRFLKIILFFLLTLCKIIFRGIVNLYINSEIGKGLVLYHAFGTMISAKSIGINCCIWHNVTIGFDDKGESPIIGDNVKIHSGAKIIGGIKIGDNVNIGPNALIIRNIPSNCVVVAQPSYIVKKNNKWVLEKLDNHNENI